MHQMIPAWVDGTLTPVEKLDVHQRGLRHKAVSVFVLRGKEILMQRRALGKYHTPGLWANTCCTHPMWDEDSAACAQRRLQDELGITGLTPEFRGQLEYRADVGGGLVEHEVVDVFVAQATAGLQVALNPDEVMDTRWMSVASLNEEIAHHPEQFTPWIKIYLKDHAGLIFAEELPRS
ncbi:Isopentenyl-diphosphate Delta-isomerase [Tritonibacter multivorans]|uniref:Isopentenyl-diphosphate Delta-isomerase n=1 Tax=Tritonibacter multivorans TaxID=928856 RepID=A0A0P1GZ37_9RHOB|nr:isopentenyl-diphosphate Delta-isomerase [Tritonibacter multivorans]MDA7420227.1 isopentenyl-diphosphate Delta-isomerase [Tritonibacter multivorans]CUH79941.1 Isopentenyl-diphosphate Delta-isomerase [Tritonibacter multivorans]SFB99213.1 isopentenyl-diphosphate delta-isomerase [Tritonibacter multivorans]